MPRMNILNALEEEAHDAPPKFTSVERKAYFELPHDWAQIAEDSLRHSTNQVSFILACGYFRAAKRFFTKSPHPRDLEYVCAKLGLSIDEISLDTYHRATAMRHRRLILSHYGYKEFDQGCGSIKTEIESMVRSQLKPRLIFYRAVDILIEQKVALPSSDFLSKLILDSLNNRRQELVWATVPLPNVFTQQRRSAPGIDFSERVLFRMPLLRPSLTVKPMHASCIVIHADQSANAWLSAGITAATSV